MLTSLVMFIIQKSLALFIYDRYISQLWPLLFSEAISGLTSLYTLVPYVTKLGIYSKLNINRSILKPPSSWNRKSSIYYSVDTPYLNFNIKSTETIPRTIRTPQIPIPTITRASSHNII
ncbi:MAG: hypothetical protein ACLSUQ_01595 [Monoglobus pectinilyticus]